jgi:hypothetical protein
MLLTAVSMATMEPFLHMVSLDLERLLLLLEVLNATQIVELFQEHFLTFLAKSKRMTKTATRSVSAT